MKIETDGVMPRLQKVGDVVAGDCFRFDGELYIKLSSDYGISLQGYQCAGADLIDGNVVLLTSIAECEPVSLKVVFDD